MGLMTAITVVSSLLGLASTYKQATAQNEQAKADMSSAYKAGSIDLSTLQERLQQTIQGTDNEIFDRQRQGEKDRSKILVAAGEANITGNSLMRMVAANMFDEARDKGIYKTNLQNQLNQGFMEAYKVKTDASSNAAYASSQRTNPFLNSLTVGLSGAAKVNETYKLEKSRGY